MHKFSKSMWKIMQTLNLLPTGEFSIVKYKKHGVWIEAAGTKIFIHFSETFTDPRKWDGEVSDNKIDSPASAGIIRGEI